MDSEIIQWVGTRCASGWPIAEGVVSEVIVILEISNVDKAIQHCGQSHSQPEQSRDEAGLLPVVLPAEQISADVMAVSADEEMHQRRSVAEEDLGKGV